jgi:hypothetical protein
MCVGLPGWAALPAVANTTVKEFLSNPQCDEARLLLELE